MIIRPETQNDLEAIEQVTLAAFMGKFTNQPNEHLIINGLREAGALSLSLVAVADDNVVGQVTFSVVTIDGIDRGWYGLGPVSVHPEFQGQGIGSALIKEGLSKIREAGAKGCVLEGSPRYYQRFGFKSYLKLRYEGAPSPEYFMALSFHDEIPEGKVEFHKAFYVQV